MFDLLPDGGLDEADRCSLILLSVVPFIWAEDARNETTSRRRIGGVEEERHVLLPAILRKRKDRYGIGNVSAKL